MDRKWIQAAAALLISIHLPNLLKGSIYQDKGKLACAPGLNCYPCPAAPGPCPIGAFQVVVGSSKFSFSYYVTDILIFFGILLGRFICGFFCPLGWFQELLNKLPGERLSIKNLRPLTFLKYAVLLPTVMILPAFAVNDLGTGKPFSYKYLCSQSASEDVIPFSVVNTGIRAALGKLFAWKFGILITFILPSAFIYRPFCKWICPLGALHALLNKVSLVGMRVDESRCIFCGECARACKMGVDVTEISDHSECICCGMRVGACPTKVVHFRCGFGAGETIEDKRMKIRREEVKRKRQDC